MRQLMHGNGRTSGPLLIEIFSVDFVVSCKIIHVDEIRSDLDYIVQVSSHRLQDRPHILDHLPRLQPDVEMCGSKLINLSSGDAVVRTASTRTRDNVKVAGTLHVRIFSARLCSALDDSAFNSSHLRWC